MKPMYIWIAVAIVVVLGGGYYFMQNGTSGTPALPNYGASSAAPTDDNGKYSGSIASLAARGGNYSCTVDNGGGTAETSGNIYINGTQLRGDFTSTIDTKVVESHLIRNADVMYVWSSAQLQGIKMTVPTGAPSTPVAGAGTGHGVDQNQNYNWKCAPWTVDSSEFNPPSSVTFIDASALMKGGTMPKTPGY